jgi:hypothetical protein
MSVRMRLRRIGMEGRGCERRLSLLVGDDEKSGAWEQEMLDEIRASEDRTGKWETFVEMSKGRGGDEGVGEGGGGRGKFTGHLDGDL